MIIAGIDLSGKEENPSGICVLYKKLNIKVILKTLYSDEDILKEMKTLKPSIVAVDAPLSLPLGRCCLEKECECALGGHFRRADLEIRSYGRMLPLTFQGMKMLTLRGIKFAAELKKQWEVIETHPCTGRRMLGLEEPEDLGKLLDLPPDAGVHELDAAMAAVTGYLYLNDCFMELGDPSEGTIIIPRGEGCWSLL